MDIRFRVRNEEKVQTFLKEVPRGTVKIGVEAIAEYIVGDSRHGLKHDDPYVQTTREAVYGRPFESDAQRKKVMAMINSGEIKIGQRNPDPTTSGQEWNYVLKNNGYNATLTNESEGAYWARGWGGWKNWRSVEKVISDNIAGALRHAGAKIAEYLRSKAKG